MATGPSGREDLAIKMRECLCKRVAAFVSLGRRRRVNVDILAHEELFQHLAGGNEEIAIAALTSELE